MAVETVWVETVAEEMVVVRGTAVVGVETVWVETVWVETVGVETVAVARGRWLGSRVAEGEEGTKWRPRASSIRSFEDKWLTSSSAWCCQKCQLQTGIMLIALMATLSII